MKKLSIIIPCYNEAENLPYLIQKLEKISFDGLEIILVNNGSTDSTNEVFSEEKKKRNLGIRLLIIKKNIGYGHGIMEGVLKASGEYIAWTHADLQTDPSDVVKAYENLKKTKLGLNSVIKGRRVRRNYFDTFFTLSMSIIASFIMGVKLSDINAQPKIFHKSFRTKLKNYPMDFSLDLFFLYQARINGYSLIEFPVSFKHRRFGESKGGGPLLLTCIL